MCFVAWQVAYLNGLIKRGVELDKAEIIVGTSAGSLVASILANGGIKRFGKQVDWISRVPALVGLLAPQRIFIRSQQRAIEMFRTADNNRPETIRSIGHAALCGPCAESGGDASQYGICDRCARMAVGCAYITAVDTYTGERLVITSDAGVSSIRAAAASSAVPGVFSPQPIHDRRCMDGGVSGSGTHCDLVAGAGRALVISLTAALKPRSLKMTIQPTNLADELTELHRAGTKAFARGP